ncbi:MAG: FkbM family methyltransferase, partial [Actinomycetota bacterium]|nr:FkbM family methyltransferase [Actinomycetota bacterium]
PRLPWSNRGGIVYERLRQFIVTRTRLGSPVIRRAVRAAKRTRRGVFEALGSDRYSHPALHDLDRKLFAYLPERDGVFIEAGAFDGYWQSNTYWFERFRGWSGVLIEPIPQLAAQARRERPRSQVFEFALVAPDFPEEHVRMRFGGTMSILVPDSDGGSERAIAHAERGASIALAESYDLEVPTKTLSAVLDEAGVSDVDLLSLDVEGNESEVLEGLDLSRHAPQYIVVEMQDQDERRPLIDRLLEPRYEFVERLSGWDCLFRRRGA